jgi:hypothetical protein
LYVMNRTPTLETLLLYQISYWISIGSLLWLRPTYVLGCILVFVHIALACAPLH